MEKQQSKLYFLKILPKLNSTIIFTLYKPSELEKNDLTKEL